MTPMELFRLAVVEIGDVSAAELSAYIEKKHGVIIEPAFIPVFKATMQELEKTIRIRQEAKSVSSQQPSQAA